MRSQGRLGSAADATRKAVSRNGPPMELRPIFWADFSGRPFGPTFRAHAVIGRVSGDDQGKRAGCKCKCKQFTSLVVLARTYTLNISQKKLTKPMQQKNRPQRHPTVMQITTSRLVMM